ncbi:hypothetical protein Tco_1491096 [Tanacetum coccineum]
MESQLETTQTEVIVNGDAPAASASTKGPIPPKTVKQKLARKNELKAKKHSSLWEAIKNRFRGNKESKKMPKTILKQQYKNFAASRSEGLDKTYDRFQKLINQLEIHDNTSSTNEAVNTAHSVSTASAKDQASTASYADDVMFSFFATQSNSPQFDNEDLKQIDTADLEEMDLKWQGNKNGDNTRRVVPVETPANSLVVADEMDYNWSYQAEEGPTDFDLMTHLSSGSSSSSNPNSENESVYEEKIAFLNYDVQVKDISIKNLKNQLEETLKEKDDLKLKLEKFEESSKNLTKLINSQISAKDKTSLGYDSQINENESEVVHSVFDSRESDKDNNSVNDRFKTSEGFHAVPPPYTGNYMPPRPYLSFARLDEYVFCFALRNTTTSMPETETSTSKTSKDIVEKPKTVRPSAPIIKEWDTDTDNDSVFRPKPKFTKIKFVKSGKNVKSVNKESTHRQVEYPRKS